MGSVGVGCPEAVRVVEEDREGEEEDDSGVEWGANIEANKMVWEGELVEEEEGDGDVDCPREAPGMRLR